MKNCRPISLRSTLYKIVTKILVGSLKPVITSLIFYNHGAFVLDRKAIENVVITQEIVARMNKLRLEKRGWVMVKLDLFKAYDKVNWNFLKNVLLSFHFSPKWVNLIELCLLR